jgi:hypothetical protein
MQTRIQVRWWYYMYNIPENDSEPHLQQISGFLQNMFVKKLDISDLFILLTNNKSL